MPLPELMLGSAIIVEALGAIALLTGLAWIFIPAVNALMIYTFVVNFVYFDFWNAEGMDAVMGRKNFLKNLAVIGGLVCLSFVFAHNRKEKEKWI